MALENPSFEDAGAAPGEAAHWTLRAFTARERVAGFGPPPHFGWEDFERWFELVLAFGPGQLALAFFDVIAEGFEDFEEGWANDFYLTELPAGQVVTAPFGGGAVEHMESGWANDTYATSWVDVTAVAGLFAGEPHESFEQGWRSNEAYAFAWEDVTSAAAIFDGGTEPHEDFENDWTPASTI